MTGFDPARERYVCLATFRRDGREVRTPVWLAGEGELFYVFSEGDAGKVKRIRATKRVRVAPCDARGRLKSETWREGRGRVLREPSEIERAYRALHRKYGWQMRAADWLSKLTGRYARRALLELEVGDGPAG